MAESATAHERAMYEIRDWYVLQHRLVRLEKEGSDRELLIASVDHIIPRKSISWIFIFHKVSYS